MSKVQMPYDTFIHFHYADWFIGIFLVIVVSYNHQITAKYKPYVQRMFLTFYHGIAHHHVRTCSTWSNIALESWTPSCRMIPVSKWLETPFASHLAPVPFSQKVEMVDFHYLRALAVQWGDLSCPFLWFLQGAKIHWKMRPSQISWSLKTAYFEDLSKHSCIIQVRTPSIAGS